MIIHYKRKRLFDNIQIKYIEIILIQKKRKIRIVNKRNKKE